jgi:cytochrome b involved in lipid metabolism
MKNFIIAFGIVVLGVGAWLLFPSPKATSTPTPVSAGTYTMAQVAAHNSAKSCWTVIDGSVYNMTSYANQHPAGAGSIVLLCGIDGTGAFRGQHGSQSRPARELVSLKIGVLAR